MANALRNLLLIIASGLFIIAIGLSGCNQPQNEKQNTKLEEVAGSEEALNFMKTFAGRGILSDSSMATPPADAVTTFRYPDDLALDLVLSEPAITQPVYAALGYGGGRSELCRLWQDY